MAHTGALRRLKRLSRRRRARQWAGLGAAILLLVGVIWLGGNKPDKRTTVPSPATTASTLDATVSAPATSSAAMSSTAASSHAAADASAPSGQTVRVLSEPAAAEVWEGGRRRCRATPCEVSWDAAAAAGSKRRLRLTKLGYFAAVVDVEPDATEVRAKLDAEPAPSATTASQVVTAPTATTTTSPGLATTTTSPEPATTTTSATATPGPSGYKPSPYDPSPDQPPPDQPPPDEPSPYD